MAVLRIPNLMPVRANDKIISRRAEQVLPAVAKIHAGEQRQFKLIFPWPLNHRHAFDPDHRRSVITALYPFARLAPQHPAFPFDTRSAVAHFGDLAVQAVVAAHKLGGEQRFWRAVHLLRRALLLNFAVVKQQDAVGYGHRFVLIVRHHQRG